MAEINKDEPDIDKLAKVISSVTGIAAKVIQTVNSSFYSPRSPVTRIKQAVMYLGLNYMAAVRTAGRIPMLPMFNCLNMASLLQV